MKPTIKNKRVQWAMNGLYLILIVSLFSGCTGLRDKFVRKTEKKIDDKDLPVLDPIDYSALPPSQQNPLDQHYLMWKLWFKDLVEKIDRQDSISRLRFAASQLQKHVSEMKELVGEDKTVVVDEILVELNAISKELDQPQMTADYLLVRRKVAQIDKKFRSHFYNPALMEK